MGRIYKENKNFVNKFSSLLNSVIKKEPLVDEKVSVIFTDGTRIRTTFDMKMSDIFIEETGRNLYFCTKLKEVNRVLLNSDYNNDATEIGVSTFNSSVLSMWNPPKDLIKELKSYLSTKFQKTLNGKIYKDMEDDEFLHNVRSTDSVPHDQLKDFPKVKEIISNVDRLIKADVDVSLHKDLFKSLKNREAFPIAYINDEKGCLYYPYTYQSNRKSMAIFTDVYFTDGRVRELSRYARTAVNYTPFSRWAVIDINLPDIDKRAYMGYNYDI